MRPSLQQIEKFLKHGTIAFVGVSRQEKDFSRLLFREFLKRGYQGIPVNPHAAQIDDRPCLAKISGTDKNVKAAMLLTAPQQTEAVVRECLRSGVSDIWIVNRKGYEALENGTKQQLKDSGVSLIAGECPFMFLEDAAWIHRFHGWMKKMTGGYPPAS